ncbi:MAG: aminotransferase class V-fold PLP-dependent enzyme, partial [Verrucomicrobiales bacterium]
LDNAFAADRFDRAVVKRGAASFSVGMPNFAALYGLQAALDYLAAVGVAEIARRADPLVRRLQDGLEELRIQPLAPRQDVGGSGIVAITHPRSEAIHEALERDKVHVMHHAGRLRIAVHGYNTEEDVDRLLRVLRSFAG